MHATRLCLGAVETCDETERHWCDSPIVNGGSARQFARQNSGDVTPCLYGPVVNSFSMTNVRVRTRIVCPRHTEPRRPRLRSLLRLIVAL
eukprot:493218-Pleurochrysis_carterae.AAC.1